jgi:four helix bundle protein
LKTHKDLQVWQRSINFVEKIYKVTGNFPKEELFGLSSQLRRSAVSIPSNIAEGGARHSNKEFLQFLYIALGSLAELEPQCLIAQRLEFLIDETVLNDIEILQRQLLNFIKYRKGNKGSNVHA